jgi:hypothetical protein
MSDGEDDGHGGEYVSCLTCGAMYVLRAMSDDPTRGDYVNSAGDGADECSRDTSMCHGYPGERHCHEHDEPCEHITHSCNCVACGS